MLVDSHCHLDFDDFDTDREAVLTRARAAGVGLMVTISTKITLADKIIRWPKPMKMWCVRSAFIRMKRAANPKHRLRN